MVVSLIEDMQPHVPHQPANGPAQVPVQRGPDLLVVGEGEADAGDAADRVAGRQHIRRAQEHLDGARNHLRNHGGIATQLAARVHRDVELAVARLPDAIGGFLGAGERGVLHR